LRRRLFLALAILASVVCYAGPLVLAGRFGSWWYLAGCLLTIPACEACWRARDRELRHVVNGQLRMVVSHCEEEMTLTNQAIRCDLDELNGVMGELRRRDDGCSN
jgi:hypothetical protein